MFFKVYDNGSLVFWVVRYQGNITGLSSDNYSGFLYHVGGKASSVSSHSSQTVPFSASRDPASTGNMSASFRMKFSLFHYTDFYLLVDLYTHIQTYMQNMFFLSVSG